MRTINTNRKFVARVFDKNIYIDTESGLGFRQVLEEMKKVMANFSHNSPISSEDFYQDLCVAVLEGILTYTPSKNTTLSTFLYKICYYKLIDSYKCKNISFESIPDIPVFSDQVGKIDIERQTQCWDGRWKLIMFRLFVNGEQIKEVALDEGITPWGLTRAVRRKLLEARNFSRKRR